MSELVLAGVVLALLALLAWKEVRHSVERARWDQSLRDAVGQDSAVVTKALEDAEATRRWVLSNYQTALRAWDVERGRYVAALIQARTGNEAVAASTVRTAAAPAAEPAAKPVVQIDG